MVARAFDFDLPKSFNAVGARSALVLLFWGYLAAITLLTFSANAQTSGSSTSTPPPMMATPGKMGVSATGAFTYTIPIIVPPGTNNLVPALSLDYSSQYGDGTVGMGWTLAGLPTITRCPRTLAQDGIHGGVNFDKNDRFCMNGQRLILISGGYGGEGSQYRTEIETFSEIIAHGTAGNGPEWFEVHSKNGQVLYFGDTSSSRLLAVGTTTVRTWAVDKILDTKGNYLTVTYTNDTTNGEAYPSEIDYTGNATSSPALAPYNKVTFSYSARAATDIVPTYQAGSLQQTTVLLSKIQTYTGISSPTLVTDYELSYLQAGQTNSSGHTATHDELTQVKQCTGAAVCFTPTKFEWQGSGPVPTVDASNTLDYGLWAAPYGSPYLVTGDFNGDGITDLVVPQPLGQNEQPYCFYIGTGAGTSSSFNGETYNFCPGRDQTYPPSPPLSRTYLVGDFNGDGLTDFIQVNAGMGAAWTPWLSTGSGFTSGTTGTTGQIPFVVGDFNGDGLSDLLYMDSETGWPSGGADIYFAKSTADGSFSALTGFAGGGNFVAAADFDGDGCTDLMTSSSSTQVEIFYAYNSLTPSLQCNPAQATATATVSRVDSTATATVTGDFNGDGKADFIDTNGTLYLSTGVGLVATNFVAPPGWDIFGAKVGDINGDGKQDIILDDIINKDVEIWASTGQTGCTPAASSCADPSHPAFTKIYSTSISESVEWVADFNNDGAADALVPTSATSATLLLTQYTPELMAEVVDGLGAKVVAKYKNLSTGGSGFYVKDHNAIYPTQDMTGPQYFVSETETSNGIGGFYVTTYKYEGAKTDLHGRGFLGFSYVTSTDTETGLVTTTQYNTVFPGSSGAPSDTPAVGAILTQQTCPATCSAPGAVVLKSLTNQWKYKNLGGTPGGGSAYYFVGLVSSEVDSLDLNGAQLPTVITNNTYDCDSALPCYGNVASVVLNTYTDNCASDPSCAVSSSKTTTNSYTNDTTDWFIGRLINSSVESKLYSAGSLVSEITRQTGFCYDLSYVPAPPGPTTCTATTGTPSGLLTAQIVEPEKNPTNPLRLETDYTLDQFGNRHVVTQLGCVYTSATTCSATTGVATRPTTYTYGTAAPYNGQFPTTIQNAEGDVDTLTYDVNVGGVTSDQNPNLLTTSWAYDGFGRATLEQQPDGTQISIAYTFCTGLPTGESCPTEGVFDVISTPENSGSSQNGAITIVYYDSLARVIAKDVEGFDSSESGCTAAAPCWIRVATTYDALGRVSTTTRPYFLSGGTSCGTGIECTTFTYDALARVTLATFPDSSMTNYGYNGLVATVKNALNETTTTTRNPQGLNASVEDANSQTTKYVYDAVGDLATITDPGLNVTTNQYDIRGRKTGTSDPDMGLGTCGTTPTGTPWCYVYDGFSELSSQIDAKGNAVTMTYDILGRLVGRVDPDFTTTWAYGDVPANHDVGLMVTAYLGDKDTGPYRRTLTYDSLARVSTAAIRIASSTYDYSFTYNTNNGQIGTATYPSGLVATYDYTANGYLDELQSGSTLLWKVKTRDAEMHALGFDEGPNITISHSYYPKTGLIHGVLAAGGTAASFDYVFDAIGNLTSRVNNDPVNGYTENFCYDALNRVTSYQLTTGTACPQTGSGITTVAYDALGDITKKSDVGEGSPHGVYSYPTPGPGVARPHAVTSISGSAVWPGMPSPDFQYDADGNQTCIGTGTGCTSPFRTTAYNGFNKVSSIKQGSATVEYVYDDARARIHQKEIVSSTQTDTFYMNYGGLMEELVTSGGVSTTHDYLTVDGEIVGDYQQSGATQTTLYYANDSLGSVSAILTAAGVVQEQDSYDAWGLRRNWNGTPASKVCGLSSSNATRGYTNQEMIDSVCMVNLNARLYDPVIGRIPQPDSIISDGYNPQGLNRYSYVNNGPLSFIDPSGNDAVYYAPDLQPGQLTNDPLEWAGQFGPSAGITLYLVATPIQAGQLSSGAVTATTSGAGTAVSNSSAIASNTSVGTPNASNRPGQTLNGTSIPDTETDLNVLVGYVTSSNNAQSFTGDSETIAAAVSDASGGDPEERTVIGQRYPMTDLADYARRQVLAETNGGTYFSNDNSTLKYAIGQYQRAFGRYDPNSPSAHSYSVGPIVICNNGPSCGWDAATHCNVPTGCSSTAVKTGDVVFAGPGWVSVNVDVANHEITNITTDVHALKPGVVSIDVIQNGNTGSVIFTGVGTGIMPQTNAYLANGVWGLTASEMAAYANGH